MSISKETKQALYKRAGGRCECAMVSCGHRSRCIRSLVPGYWDAHKRNRNGDYVLGNLIAMCATCHKNTRTYGLHK
jgi:hypothetical protein